MAGSDVHSSHIIEGMVEYLLDTLDFDSLKRQLNFYFIPVANIDGVKYGNTATNLTGTHLANDWKNTHKIYQAETHSLK
jgi:murein tripeptide amidase MpaA